MIEIVHVIPTCDPDTTYIVIHMINIVLTCPVTTIYTWKFNFYLNSQSKIRPRTLPSRQTKLSLDPLPPPLKNFSAF